MAVQASEDLQAMVVSADPAALEEVVAADRCVVVEEVAAEPADLRPIKRTRSTTVVLFRSFIMAASFIHRAPTLFTSTF